MRTLTGMRYAKRTSRVGPQAELSAEITAESPRAEPPRVEEP